MAHFLWNVLIAGTVIFSVTFAWAAVQELSRRFAKSHPEFENICEEKSDGCGLCRLKDICEKKEKS